MVADGLLTRQRYREVPPRVDYELTARSKDLLPVLGALARWGYDWAWTAPRESEAIDIGAILRIAPGLVEPSGSTSGVAAFAVHVDAQTTKHYALTVRGGSVAISEVEDAAADASVSGSQEDWIDALGPDADRSGLRIDGNQRLASMLLDAIGAFAERGIKVA
jgi:hypothetical protein